MFWFWLTLAFVVGVCVGSVIWWRFAESATVDLLTAVDRTLDAADRNLAQTQEYAEAWRAYALALEAGLEGNLTVNLATMQELTR